MTSQQRVPVRASRHGAISTIGLVLLLLSSSTNAISPTLDDAKLWDKRRQTHRKGEDAAIVDAWRTSAFRPYDASTSPPVDYGGRHPFELHEQRRLRDRDNRNLQDYFAKEMYPNKMLNYRDEGDYVTPAVHRPIRIHFDTTKLEAERGKAVEVDAEIDLIVSAVLPAAAEVWSDALRVIPVVGSITVPSGACWVGGGEGFEVSGADVVIVVYSDVQLCAKVSTAVASAAACITDQYDRPVVGAVNFCLSAPSDDQRDLGRLIGTATHELGHVLGFMSEMVKYFRDGDTGEPLTPRPFTSELVECLDGTERFMVKPSILAEGVLSNGARYFELTTPRVTAVVRNHFDCQTLTGLRFETQPTNKLSCFGSHIDERLFFSELMGAIYTESMVLSALTLAYLEDTGWYKADYSRALISPFGHRAGCSFVNSDCIVGGDVPDYGRDFFCNIPLKLSDDGKPIGTSELLCDPSRRWKAACDLVDRSQLNDQFLAGGEAELPTEFQYFPESPSLGAAVMPFADFCPIPTLDVQDCQDSSNDGQLETFGPNSYCYTAYDSYYYDGIGFRPFQPLCLETRCNAEERIIEIVYDETRDVVKCKEDGELQFLPGTGFNFVCPRFAVICKEIICPANCSGRGICSNDEADGPKCVCFDENDKSPGCFGSDAYADTSSNTPTGSPAEATELPTMPPTKEPALRTNSPTEIEVEVATATPTASDATPVPTMVEIIKLGPRNSVKASLGTSQKLFAVALISWLTATLCYS